MFELINQDRRSRRSNAVLSAHSFYIIVRATAGCTVVAHPNGDHSGFRLWSRAAHVRSADYERILREICWFAHTPLTVLVTAAAAAAGRVCRPQLVLLHCSYQFHACSTGILSDQSVIRTVCSGQSGAPSTRLIHARALLLLDIARCGQAVAQRSTSMSCRCPVVRANETPLNRLRCVYIVGRAEQMAPSFPTILATIQSWKQCIPCVAYWTSRAELSRAELRTTEIYLRSVTTKQISTYD